MSSALAEDVRVITTIGHVDHGKTTFVDYLLAANNIISSRMAGKIRYMDSREDEQERGITMESSAVSLRFKIAEKSQDGGSGQKTYVINLIDTPGHVDFSGEVSSASRLCDGALLLVDVVEGVCTQTISVLRQAWIDRAKPILVLNKCDRLITELKLTPLEAYHHLSRLLEQVNAVMGSFYAGERMEDDLRWHEERERRLAKRRDNEANAADAASGNAETADSTDREFQEKDDEDLYFGPERGNVIFASAIDGWGFRIGKFAQLYAAKLGIKEANLRKVLWGDYYLDPKTKRVIGYKHLRGRTLKPLFVQFVLDNIWAVYDSVVLNPNPDKVTKIVATLNLQIPPRDLKSKDTRYLLALIFGQWLSLSTCTIQAVIDVIPAPSVAQATRMPKMLYPDLHQPTLEPKNKLERELFSCDSSEGACIVAYVSKMFAVEAKDLPENKRKPLTAEEMRERGREMRREKEATEQNGVNGDAKEVQRRALVNGEEPLSSEVIEGERNVLLGFARLYSGRLRTGSSLYCVLPRYNGSLGPSHPRNTDHIVKAKVEALYIMMGRDLELVDTVRAGNVFALRGLEGKVWRRATLCAPNAEQLLAEKVEEDKDCLINLGGIVRQTPPIVRVALEPTEPANLPKLVEGLRLLSQADPAVETFQQQTGEHVILTAGELHLERCLKDLRERFAKVDIQPSAPIVPFRETAIKAPEMAPPKNPNLPRGTIQGSSSQSVVKFRIRAAPLPKPILAFIQDNLLVLKRISRERKLKEQTVDSSLDNGPLSQREDEDDLAEGVSLHGDVIRKPTIRPDEFWTGLEAVCKKVGSEWQNLADRVWAFGPQAAGGCILVDSREEGPMNSLRNRLRRIQGAESAKGKNRSLQDAESSVETGFQIATFRGPLCAEPVEGLAYFVESLQVDSEAKDYESSQVIGSLISAVQDACRSGLLDWSPRLMLAMYTCDIQASTDVLGRVYGVVAKRRGRIVSEEMKEGTTFFTVRALVPVVESFGFADEIRKRTSGAASPQLIFSGYEMLDLDPFWVPTTEEELEDLGEKSDRENIAKTYMDRVRERKGLFVDRKIVEFAEKQQRSRGVLPSGFPTAAQLAHTPLPSSLPHSVRVTRLTRSLPSALCTAVDGYPSRGRLEIFTAMATATTAIYNANERTASNTQEEDPQAGDDQLLPTFYCRALYDYQATDGSSLSFYRGDIIEVLTQLESGWWDGLLGEERGWFPSNYVQPISDAEAETELGLTLRANEVHDSAIDVSQQVRGGGAGTERDREWIQETDYSRSRQGYQDVPHGTMGAQNAASNHDFWLPEVDPSGQIYYVNTQTGERSRDLPAEVGADAPDSELGSLPSTSSVRPTVRNGAQAAQFGKNTNGFERGGHSGPSRAGFGFAKRSGTPEPWTKRLADDGLTYYYFNKITGQIQWTRPTPENGTPTNPGSGTVPRIDTTATSAYSGDPRQNGRQYVPGPASTTSGYASTNDTMFTESRLRADSVTSQNQSSKRDSVYSDDSDVHPRDNEGQERPVRPANGAATVENDPGLTPAERSALILQRAIAPPEPESIDSLADQVRDAIIVVMASVDDNGLPKGADHDKEVEQNVNSVVVAVRNLLFVSCALSGPLPNAYGERDAGDPTATAVAQQLQAQLKSSQRKVTATLSKLVLSARAARYKRESLSSEMMIRVEQDAADLQRAVDNFVAEVKKQYARTVIKQLHRRIGRKRLRGIFDLQHIGLGLPGAGVAGSWKGFGFINVDEGLGLPKRPLNDGTISEAKTLQEAVDEKLTGLITLLQGSETTSDHLLNHCQSLLAEIWAYLNFIVDVNVCQEVDVGGLRGEQTDTTISDDPYMRAVAEARSLLRKFETIVQCVYDDASILFTFSQNVPFKWASIGKETDPIERQSTISSLYSSARILKTETGMIIEYLDKLLAISREQIASEGPFRESMALRISRMSIMDGNRRLSNFFGPMSEAANEDEDVVDMGFAIRKGAARPAMTGLDAFSTAETASPRQDALSDFDRASMHKRSMSSSKNTMIDQDLPEDDDIIEKRPAAGSKLMKFFGEDTPARIIEIANADAKPWYLRADHKKEEIIFNDGAIRAGTMPALVERLTTHEYADPVFIKTFLMTYKSFTTLNELFDLLVQRYWLQPPDGLKQNELEEWTKLKQHIVRSRVLNTFKTMVTDDDVLVEDDLYILDRIKEFLLHPEVSTAPAAKTLLNIIERKKQGGLKPLTVTPPTSFPPQSIIPKGMNKGKLKLLDIDSLELARQLTIMEFALYKKIKAIECLQRSREQKAGEHKDHITDVIQMTNKIANWVNTTILGKEDSRKRAALVKQWIQVAERCRNLNNFSSMAAIISGLNSPPIRRLKRTWEQVSGRFMSQLGSCEMTLDSTKNFTNYKATLAQTNPPGIPFIGVYLTTLTFINDGSKDILPGNLINFGKRQRAAEIIREIQRWQSKDFNLAPLPPILAFIEESLSAFNESVDWGEHFWNLSLDREPREREDEKMARLLQESGFL